MFIKKVIYLLIESLLMFVKKNNRENNFLPMYTDHF